MASRIRKVKIGYELQIGEIKGVVSRINEDGTFSCRYETEDGARFIHQVNVREITKVLAKPVKVARKKTKKK